MEAIRDVVRRVGVEASIDSLIKACAKERIQHRRDEVQLARRQVKEMMSVNTSLGDKLRAAIAPKVVPAAVKPTTQPSPPPTLTVVPRVQPVGNPPAASVPMRPAETVLLDGRRIEINPILEAQACSGASKEGAKIRQAWLEEWATKADASELTEAAATAALKKRFGVAMNSIVIREVLETLKPSVSESPLTPILALNLTPVTGYEGRANGPIRAKWAAAYAKEKAPNTTAMKLKDIVKAKFGASIDFYTAQRILAELRGEAIPERTPKAPAPAQSTAEERVAGVTAKTVTPDTVLIRSPHGISITATRAELSSKLAELAERWGCDVTAITVWAPLKLKMKVSVEFE